MSDTLAQNTGTAGGYLSVFSSMKPATGLAWASSQHGHLTRQLAFPQSSYFKTKTKAKISYALTWKSCSVTFASSIFSIRSVKIQHLEGSGKRHEYQKAHIKVIIGDSPSQL